MVERLRTLWSSEKSMAASRAPAGPYGRAPKGDGGQSSLLSHPYGRACLRILKGPIWSLPDADKRVNLLSLMVFRPYGSLLSFCRASNQFQFTYWVSQISQKKGDGGTTF